MHVLTVAMFTEVNRRCGAVEVVGEGFGVSSLQLLNQQLELSRRSNRGLRGLSASRSTASASLKIVYWHIGESAVVR
jgi:hypothetical protein